MANTTIRLKKSSVSAHLPDPTQLDHGEIALNYADGKIFYKDPANNIQQISGSANTFYTVNASGTLLVATSPTDILSINSGENIEIAGDFLTDTLTITANLKSAFDRANAAFDRANSSNDVLYVAAAYDTANAAYNKANAANVLAYNTGIGANGYAVSVGLSANNYAGYMANAANAYAASLTPNLAPAFSQANQAYIVANAAFAAANLAASAASINIGATPPTPASAGNLWWDTISGRMFIYYTDADSSQWVEASPSGAGLDVAAVAANVYASLLVSSNVNTSNTTQIVDSYSTTQYRTAKYIIQATSNTSGDVQASEVLLTHNDNDPYLTEYGTILTGNTELYTVSANISTGNVNLLVTSSLANTVVDIARVQLLARSISGTLAGDMMSLSGTEDLGTGSGTEDLML